MQLSASWGLKKSNFYGDRFLSLTSLSCREYLRRSPFRVILQRAYRLTLPRMRADLRVRVYVRASMQFSICHRFRNWTEMQHEIGGCASPTIPASIARFVSFCRRGCSRDVTTAVGSDTRRFITHVAGIFIAFWQKTHSGNLMPEIMVLWKSEYELKRGYFSAT